MKTTLSLFAAALLMAGCSKCYDCTQIDTVQGSNTTTMKYEFCGTKREYKDFIESTQGTKSIKNGSQTVYIKTNVLCKQQ